MRNILKAATLENKFPLLTVENDCIVSKDADVTVAFQVELPELFTVASSEYLDLVRTWYGLDLTHVTKHYARRRIRF